MYNFIKKKFIKKQLYLKKTLTATLLKRDSNAVVFLRILQNYIRNTYFEEHFRKTISVCMFSYKYQNFSEYLSYRKHCFQATAFVAGNLDFK